MNLIKQYAQNIKKSEFSQNVITLMTGSTISRLIPVIVAPVLTRIYSPEDFGTLALYTTIVLILSVIVSGRYELAILLPEKDKEAFSLIGLSTLIAIVVSTFIFIIIIFLKQSIIGILNNNEISIWLYYIPISLFLMGVIQIIKYWYNRKKQYKQIAFIDISQVILIALFSIIFGIMKSGAFGLILSNVISLIIIFIFMGAYFITNSKDHIKDINIQIIKYQAKKYIHFPKHLIVGHLFNALSWHIPVFFLSYFTNSMEVGYYSLVVKVLGLPVSFIVTSLGMVFRQRATEDYIKTGNCRPIFVKTSKYLFYVSIFPFLAVFILSPYLFPLIFGENWVVSGKYAQIVCMAFFVQFVTSSVSYMFIIAEKTNYDLIWQTFFVVFSILSLYCGLKWGDTYVALILYTFVRIVMYMIAFIASYKLSVKSV